MILNASDAERGFESAGLLVTGDVSSALVDDLVGLAGVSKMAENMCASRRDIKCTNTKRKLAALRNRSLKCS